MPCLLKEQYITFGDEDGISAERGCLLWGMRVIIPEAYRRLLVKELHNDTETPHCSFLFITVLSRYAGERQCS